MAIATQTRSRVPSVSLSEHIFAPRLWVGMNARGWWRLLRQNQFRVGWQYWHVAAAVTGWSAFNSLWATIQNLGYGRAIDRVEIKQQPLFILGHWRAGTTLLHELMVLDERYTFPTTYACLAPNHFLRSEPLVSRWFRFVLPKRRPMDNMLAGWNRPQEEEFALCNLGIPSPYLSVAFPNLPHKYEDYLTLENLPRPDVEAWKLALLRFLKQITYRTQKQLVLKSPPHTARVSTLLEMFPNAKFIHLVRDPATVFASTLNLWKSLYVHHGLQKPRFEGLEEYVLSTFERMYRKYEADRALLRPEQVIDIRYEDLVADPVDEIARIYNRLELGGFDEVRRRIEAYLAATDGYQTNKYPSLTPEQHQAIERRWLPLMHQYGY